MKILLSAFAIAPHRGSEYGVGWHWAEGLAELGHDVTVLTQERNRIEINKFGQRPRLEYIYVGLLGTGHIPGGTLGHYLYYYAWQVAAFFLLVRSGVWRKFDIVHHLTYGGIRANSLLWLLPKPFMIGPVGGGENCPLHLVWPLGRKALITELLRRSLNILARFDPLFLLTQWRAVRVVCKTPETKNLIFPAFRQKTIVSVEIGIPVTVQADCEKNELFSRKDIDVLFAGRVIYWKGYALAVEAIKIALNKRPSIKAAFIGDGKELYNLRQLVAKHSESIVITGRVNQLELFEYYRRSKIFLFPSLHDSSGNVVLEAMLFGLPVLCFDLGGPPIIVGDTGVVVASDGGYADVVSEFADALLMLLEDPELWHALSTQTIKRAQQTTWRKAITDTYFGLNGF